MTTTELDNPPVTTPEALMPTRGAGGSMLDRWIERDPKQAIERLDTMVKMLEALRSASIKATYPSDWLIHVSRDQDGNVISERGYLQDIGAERAGKLWGIEVGEPAIEEKNHADGTIAVYMIAEAWSKVTGERLDYVEGSRWSGDPFFRKSVGPDEKVDPTDVRKSAYANLHGRAVRSLSGLNGVPLEVLRAAAVDTAKVVMIDYAKGAKGGESTGAAVGTADVLIPFGKNKGKRLIDVEMTDLEYHLKAVQSSLEDPERAKYRKANERLRDALKSELERRNQAKDEATADDVSPGARLRGDVWTRLVDAAGKQAIPLLQQLTRELGQERKALSECSEEELAKLAAIPEANLKTVAGQLAARKS